MVSKKARLSEVEDCLKALTSLLPATEEVRVDSFSSKNKDRFYTLMSKYASFKQDPELKGVVESLEDQYAVSPGFRTQVEEYISRRKKLAEKEKAEDIVEREQQRIENREDQEAQAAASEGRLTLPQLEKLARSMGERLEKLEEIYGSMEKVESKLVEMMEKDPKQVELAAIYVSEMVSPADEERFFAKMPQNQQERLRKAVKSHRKRLESGAPRIWQVPAVPGDKVMINPDATLSSGKRVRDVYPDNCYEVYEDAANARWNYGMARGDFELGMQVLCYNIEGLPLEQQQSVLAKVYSDGAVTVGKMEKFGISKESRERFTGTVNGARGDTKPKSKGAKKRNDQSNLNIKAVQPVVEPTARVNELVDVVSLKNAKADREKTPTDVSLERTGSEKMDPNVAGVVATYAEANITKDQAASETQRQQEDTRKGRA